METKTKAKRTPGPWHYQEVSDAYTHIVRGPNNYFVAQLSQDTSGRSEADARLMAAAPELLEACRKLANEASGFLALSDVGRHGMTNSRILRDRIEEARVAIAKTGEVPSE